MPQNHLITRPSRFLILSASLTLIGLGIAAVAARGPSSRAPIFYATHGGHLDGGRYLTESNDLFVAPFVTPSKTLRFRKMAATFRAVNPGRPYSQCSFGIYDSEGQAVALSEGFIVEHQPSLRLIEVEIRGRLEPDTLYFTAWGYSEHSPRTQELLVPDVLQTGYVPGVVSNGIIPESFDPAQIVHSDTALDSGRSITLTLER